MTIDDGAGKFKCFIFGGDTLPVRCGELLLERGHQLLGVVSADGTFSDWARQRGVPVIAPDSDLEEVLGRDRFDYLFSIANLAMIPDAILALPEKAAINYHDGPLPQYAGLHTTSWGIANRERDWAITWHLMNRGADRGDIVEQRRVEIADGDTAFMLNAKCYEAAIESFAELLDEIAEDRLSPREQDFSTRVYYSKFKRPPAACVLGWDRSAEELSALVRALDFGPYPNPLGVPKIALGETALAVGEAEILPNPSSSSPGTVVAVAEEGLTLATRTHDLVLRDLTKLDDQPTTGTEAAAACGVEPGAILADLPAEESQRITELYEQTCRQEDFWRPRLAASQPPAIPYANAAVADAGRASHAVAALSLSDELRGLLGEGRTGQDQADLLATAFAAYLARLTGSYRFAVGYSHPSLRRDVQGLEWLFASQVPLRVALDEEDDAASALGRLSAELGSTRAAGTYPHDLLMRHPELQGRNGAVALPIHIEQSDRPGTPAPPPGVQLSFVVRADSSDCEWVYECGAFDGESIARMQSQFQAFLANVLGNAAAPLRDARLLSDAEFQQLVSGWNDTGLAYPDDSCVHEYFERQARRTPDAVAVVSEDESLSYRDLDARANRLAHYLSGHGIGRGDRVGVYIDRSLEMIVGLLGVLKAGAAYVPLDPTYPRERIAFMIDDVEAKAVLTQEPLLGSLGELPCPTVCIDRDWQEISAHGDEPIASGVTAEDLCYVIYTSGSTGKPKGVMLRHRNVSNFFAGMDGVVPHDSAGVWLAVTSISFDISVLELFWTLAHGFEVVLYADRTRPGSAESEAPMLQPASPASRRPIGFSLFYFASDSGEKEDRYRLLLEGARFADENGFEAVWTPERHFHAFGGLYPNPSVASAAIAAITKNVKIRAGSCVSPLHNPIRIAEEWAFVDNISNGRVGISFAAGWQPNDFVLKPETFADRKNQMFRDIEAVQDLWRGKTLSFPGPLDEPVEVSTLPRPVQPELPTWVTIAGNPESFQMAGERGCNLLTHLLGQSVEELAEKLEIYRKAWNEKGHPGEGHVTLMLHTFVGDDIDEVRETVRRPMVEYLRTSFELVKLAAWSFPAFKQRATETGKSPLQIFESRDFTPEEQEELLEFSFERYFETSGLFGTPASCMAMVNKLRETGVDEIGCLIDYGVDSELMLEHLGHLNQLRELATSEPAPAGSTVPELVERHGVTHMQCTPTMAKMLTMDEEGRGALGRLDTLLVGGEALPAALAAELRGLLPGDLVNMYGPTETTVWSTTCAIDEPMDPVLIGRPIANTQIYILDDALHPVPVGVGGELFIGGDGVAQGYWQRPELTAERFIRDPFSDDPQATIYRTGDLARYLPDGSIEYLGRLDHQVKIRGFRIELGEIESVVAQHPGVEQVVVVGRESKQGDMRLLAYIVPGSGSSLAATELRSFVLKRLPEYMVPSMFITLPSLPLTPNGKIDRRALPQPEQVAAETERKGVAPTTSLERELCRLWEEVLGQEGIGIQDNFFEIGGNSLLAAHLFALIEQRTGKRLPLATLFRAPTVQKLAGLLDEQGAEAPEWESLVPINSAGVKPPFFCVHAEGGNVLNYYDMAKAVGPDQPFYGLQARGLDGEDLGVRRYEEMAADYLQEVRSLQPHGPYYLGGYCLGADVAYEMAQQLVEAGEEVALVLMIENPRPHYKHPAPAPGTARVSRATDAVVARYRTEITEFRIYGLRRIGRPIGRAFAALMRGSERLLGSILSRFGLHMRHSKAYMLAELVDRHNRAYADYHPKPYQGRTAVYRTQTQPGGVARDDTLGWGELLKGEVEFAVYPDPPFPTDTNSQALGEQIRASLERAQERVARAADRSPTPEEDAVATAPEQGSAEQATPHAAS